VLVNMYSYTKSSISFPAYKGRAPFWTHWWITHSGRRHSVTMVIIPSNEETGNGHQ